MDMKLKCPNAWYTHTAQGRVWFEGQDSQGEGGEITLAQFKRAIERYVRYLADPASKPIAVALSSQ